MALRFAHIGLAAVAIVFVTIPLTGHTARAFTIDTESATDAYGNARFADPDEQVQNFGRGGSLFGQGGPSVQFGAPAPFDRAQGGSNWLQQPLGPR
jgi:hypothetical protein